MTRSKSPLSELFLSEIDDATSTLIEKGYVDDQNYMALSHGPASWSLDQSGAQLNLALKKKPYADIYNELFVSRSFVLLMLDGALIQISYEGSGNEVLRHRLAYLPSPTLMPFQNDADIYLNDVQFGEIVGHQVIPVPVRFDLDARPGVARDLVHPTSHLTLGQYKHCRIPVSRPISPVDFLSFVIDSFYSTPEMGRASFKRSVTKLADTISVAERMSGHLAFP